MECLRCGTCCTAPDISTLGKPAGVPCRRLGETGLCTIYDQRPAVCRGYRPDEICLLVAAPTLEERVERYLRLFGLDAK
uniref:YkgJ family cysteine cluster protein n=1 Tax=Geobacter metallireducens TaxID=28232 RepID=A0A831TZ90_GEOME